MKHLQRVWHTSRERLPFQTPGSFFVYGLAFSLIVETINSKSAVIFYFFSLTLGTFLISLIAIKKLHINFIEYQDLEWNNVTHDFWHLGKRGKKGTQDWKYKFWHFSVLCYCLVKTTMISWKDTFNFISIQQSVHFYLCFCVFCDVTKRNEIQIFCQNYINRTKLIILSTDSSETLYYKELSTSYPRNRDV